MARQLIYGNDIVGFNPTSGIVTAKGYVPLPKLLSITNSTVNTTIYSFSDPDTTAVVNYDSVKNQTTFDLSFNTSAMSVDDKLQIFYEKEDIEIAPSKHLLDPVGKLRVSQPESLIDTDFEYGQQSTKWETLKLVNNIPTSYSSGIPEESIEVLSVKSDAGNDFITIETPEPHGFIVGSVIEVSGLKDPKYEGVFIIRDVTDTTTFSYKLSFKSPKSEQLETEFTTIYAGSFYTGSSIDILDVETSTGAGSTFLVTTENIPGIVENTKLFLKGARATKRYDIESPSAIVSQPSNNYQTTIHSPGPGIAITRPSSTVYLAQLPIIEEDWIGHTEYNFPSSQISISGTTAGKITIDKNFQINSSGAENIEEGDVLVYYTPRGNTYPGPGIGSYHPFKVVGVATTGTNDRYVSFNVSSTFATNTPLTLSSAGTDTFGFHRFMKASGGRIVEVDRRGTILFSKKHGLQYGDEIVICTRSTNTGFTTTRGNWLSNVYYKYKIVNIIDDFRIHVNPRFRTSQKFNTPTERFVCVVKVVPHPMANSFYLPPDAGFPVLSYKTAQQVRYTTNNLGTNGIPSPLVANRDYLIRQIKDAKGQYFYSLYEYFDANLKNPIKINIRNPETTFRSSNGLHRFTSTLIRDDAFTISINVPPRADLTNNQLFRYSVGTTGQAVGGMSSQGLYFAKTDDTLIGNTQFRVSNFPSSLDVKNFTYSGYNRTTATFGILTGAAHTVGIARTQFLQVTGYQGTAAENLMIQGLHQVVGIQTYYSYYWYYTRRWRRRWRRRYYWYYHRVWQVRRREPITYVTVSVPTTKNRLNVFYKNILTSVKACGIVSLTSPGGIGTHIITIESIGAADDTYTVTQVQPTSFVFNSNTEVPEVINSLSGGDGSRVGVGSNWVRIPDHRLADGTKIRYENFGFANIAPLQSGQEYFVRALDGNHIGFSTLQDIAINRNNDIDNLGLIPITSFGSTTTHQFISRSIKGFITGPGAIGVSTESNLVRGTNTKFFTDFSNGDVFRIWWKQGNVAGPGTYFESRITEVKSNTVIKLEDEVGIETSSANYFIPTRLYAVSDAKVLHRPFDGALTMTTGLTPNTQLIRQTRRYFRYQAGKGIQCSMAVNFNPTFDIDSIDISGQVGVSTDLIVTTKFPHGLSTESPLDDEQRFQILNVTYPVGFNTEYVINEVIDDFKVRIQTQTPLIDPAFGGFPQFNITHWRDGRLKCGMFDDQNGLFFMFDGDRLNVVRRSNTQQLAGRISVTRGENLIRATDGRFRSQLRNSDKIVLRGQTYKVVSILDDDLAYIQPAYRGRTINSVVGSKVIDTIIPQTEWNIDRMDGTGYSGYNIDTNRVQMVYMDYSWYGAGTIRFGMKTQLGEIKYCHEFIHNNQFTEAYFRSGNLPVRYEVETLDDPFFAPSLYHWGVSVIMDGRFDQDKSYHFTADSKILPFTNGGVANVGGIAPSARVSTGSTEIWSIAPNRGSTLAVGEYINSPTPNVFQKNTRITSIEMDPLNPGDVVRLPYYYWSPWNYGWWNYTDHYRVFIDKEVIAAPAGSITLYSYSGTAETLKEFIPLVSIRLSPSVDNSATGSLGYRDIVNRMQILLRSANVITTHDCEVELIVNGKLQAEDDFESVGSPSLCQLFRHDVGDTITGGQVIYSFRAQGGSSLETVIPSLYSGWNSSLKRSLNGTTVDLHEVAVLGNSVLGGDSLYPDGPDVLTLAVKPIDTSMIKGSSPLVVSARITWIESQA
jgi:hypothetical protein